MIFMPPRHGKSELASRRFPSWYLGRNPNKQIIAASYNSDLASDFGREVRDIVKSPEYHNLFSVSLAEDSRAVNRWHTNKKGVYIAAGVGTAITGRGANVALIDDPFKDRQEADSETTRNAVWNWYTSTLRTRLMPGGAIVLIQCMTGDTPVLMADGNEKPLAGIQVGDMVATYNDGKLSTNKVLNHCSNGADSVFRIRTTSGIIVRANERHPFLVDVGGKPEWIRLKDLRLGQEIYRVNGANGKAKLASSKDVTSLLAAGGIASPTTTKKDGLTGFALHQVTKIRRRVLAQSSSIVMGLLSMITKSFSGSRVGAAQSAGLSQKKLGIQSTGIQSFALTTAMIQGRLEDCSAIAAIWLSGTKERLKFWKLRQTTSDFTLDKIVSIELDGVEEVFDVQIEGTENFIANGLVSHNTRWHEDDLAGRLLKHQKERWEILELEAISNEDTNQERALWPEWFNLETLKEIRRDVGQRDWNALYQQKPTVDQGTYFKREWFKRFNLGEEPITNKYQSSDYAVTDSDGDYTELGVWGVDPDNDLWALDWWYGQKDASQWINAQLQQIKKNNTICSFGETGVIRKAIEPFLRKRATQENIYSRFEWIARTKDKATMARAFQGMASMGKVHIPNTAWGDRLINQLVAFPAGEHDDAVDVCALIALALSEAHPAIEEIIQDSTNSQDRWDKAFEDETEDSWKTV